MPDWEQIVGQRLGRMKLPPEERCEVVSEVAAHLEECYSELCAAGSPDPVGYTLAQVPDWKALGRKIQRSKEGPMNRMVRIFVCGLLTGIVAGFTESVIRLVGGGDFLPAVAAVGQPSSFPGWSGSIETYLVLHAAASIWTLWLYTAIRPRYGPGSKTAAVAGFARWWVIDALGAAMWSTQGLIPLKVFLVAALVGLPAWILGAMAGAWSFEATERRPSPALKAA